MLEKAIDVLLIIMLNDAAQSPAERPGPALHPVGVGLQSPGGCVLRGGGQSP
jgi:hypothetical protein